ncbi:hypothetical protein I7I53_12206 [Histoplasma capsulatum var. duboisii H88]|uniref:Uncharacterized protein n=1 Tax=Ajellomyces capsulatus (strain H88) TaxID=544711 RepID=A0A8A1LZC8_AJEC8|nr:hypothetical protein I7I53_12206 [Histoplasma capsulatum var. duboisii H88]
MFPGPCCPRPCPVQSTELCNFPTTTRRPSQDTPMACGMHAASRSIIHNKQMTGHGEEMRCQLIASRSSIHTAGRFDHSDHGARSKAVKPCGCLRSAGQPARASASTRTRTRTRPSDPFVFVDCRSSSNSRASMI